MKSFFSSFLLAMTMSGLAGSAPVMAISLDVSVNPTHDIQLGVLALEVTENLTSGPNTFTTYHIIDDRTVAPTFAAGAITTRRIDLGFLVQQQTAPVLFFGLYDNGGQRGVSVSMADASAITAGSVFSDVFPGFSEVTMQVLLQSIDDGLIESGIANYPIDLYQMYGSTIGIGANVAPIQLVNFSQASDGGSLSIAVVPEISPSALLCLGLCFATAWCPPRIAKARRTRPGRGFRDAVQSRTS